MTQGFADLRSGTDLPGVAECRGRFARGEPVTADARAVCAFLDSPAMQASSIIETDEAAIVLDLSHDSPLLGGRQGHLGVESLSRRIRAAMNAAGTGFAFGRYAEPRGLYDNEHFAGAAERRTVHMGIDLFCVAGSAIRAPLAGSVYLVANNARELDYGPMLILRHEAGEGRHFYSLYGHLSQASVESLATGDEIGAGEVIAAVGAPPENGNWPPHLHFQLILDLLALGAGFPGVAAAAEQDFWLALSPSPAAFFPSTNPEALVYPR